MLYAMQHKPMTDVSRHGTSFPPPMIEKSRESGRLAPTCALSCDLPPSSGGEHARNSQPSVSPRAEMIAAVSKSLPKVNKSPSPDLVIFRGFQCNVFVGRFEWGRGGGGGRYLTILSSWHDILTESVSVKSHQLQCV